MAVAVSRRHAQDGPVVHHARGLNSETQYCGSTYPVPAPIRGQPKGRSVLRLAAVQIDAVSPRRVPKGAAWTPSEPLWWRTGTDLSQEFTLQTLGARFSKIQAVRGQIEPKLLRLQNRRLQQVLSYLEDKKVSLAVFPEYSIIPDPTTIELFKGYAKTVATVVGFGSPNQAGQEAILEHCGHQLEPATNVAVVFHDAGSRLITKKNEVTGEGLTPGVGVEAFTINIDGAPLRLAVGICKDYIVAGHSLESIDPPPDLVAIPAFSPITQPFFPDAPRDFPRILSNQASAGGSTILMPGLEGLLMADDCPLPLPIGCEGIVAVDWNSVPKRPTATRDRANRVALRSAIVTKTDGQAAAETVTAYANWMPTTTDAADAIDRTSRWLNFLESLPSLRIVADSVALFANGVSDGTMDEGSRELLTAHLLCAETPSLGEHRDNELRSIVTQLTGLLQEVEAGVPDYDSLLEAVQIYSRNLEPRVLKHAAREGPVVCHFCIGLGPFDSDEALATLPDQVDLLSTFVRSAPAGSHIEFALRTRLEPANGLIAPLYTVSFHGDESPETTKYLESFESIARTIFRRGWEMYNPEFIPHEGTTFDLVPESGEVLRGRDDLSLLVDVLRGAGGGIKLGITCHRPRVSAERGKELPTREETPDPVVGLGVRISMPKENAALLELVNTILFEGAARQERAQPDGEYRPSPVALSGAQRLLHPPHGFIAGRGLSRRRTLSIPVTDMALPSSGAMIGRAQVVGPSVDTTVDVYIPPESRLLHTYLVGRTGVGKTNTLKNIVRHDLTLPSPVIVVDPHGDLFDYAVKHCVGKRDFVALDFGSAEQPSLNPLYLDASDYDGVMRNIEDIVELLVRSTHHEFAGPRFRDMARLCLESLVVVADERQGDYATIADLPALVEDLRVRSATIAKLRTRGRQDLVLRWESHMRMKREEQAEVEQWFISKFADFRHSPALRRAVSGRPSVSLERTLSEGQALFARIAPTALGPGSSHFLGSILVDRTLRFTMGGGFSKFESPAMLVVDEFQYYVGTSFASLIPEARKFNLGLTLANQTLSQLSSFNLFEGTRSSELTQILLGNVGNVIVQGVSKEDAGKFGDELGIATERMQLIGKHRAVVTLTVGGERLAPFTVDLSNALESPGGVADGVAQEAVASSVVSASESVVLPDLQREMWVEAGQPEVRAPVQGGNPDGNGVPSREQGSLDDVLSNWGAELEKRDSSESSADGDPASGDEGEGNA